MRWIWVFFFGMAGLVAWGIASLEPFILIRKGDSLSSFLSQSPVLGIFLRTLLLFLQGMILFRVLQQSQPSINKNWDLLCLLLFLVHPLAGESVAFAFQSRELIGNTLFLTALLLVIQGNPWWLSFFCYTLSFFFSPGGWFFPFLVFFLPNRPRFWWISLGTLGIWILGLFSQNGGVSIYWKPLAFPHFFYLLYPRGPSFPATKIANSWVIFFFGLLLLGFAGWRHRKNPSSFFPVTLIFLGFLCCGPVILSFPSFSEESWALGFPGGLLFLWSLLWVLGYFASQRKWVWGLGASLVLFWMTLQALLFPTIQRPDQWMKARALYTQKREDWLRIAQFYESHAYYQQGLEVLQEASQFGHEVRLEQLKYLGFLQKEGEQMRLAQDLIHSAPPHPYPHQILGELALKEGQWDEALKHFDQAEHLTSEDFSFSADFFLSYGQILLELGQTAKAKNKLEKAYFLNPESRTLWLNLARLYLQEEKLADALFFLRKGIFGNARQEISFFQKELFSGNGKTLLLKYIDLLIYHGHRKTALQVLREAQEKAPDEKMFLFYEALLLQTPPLSVLRQSQELYRAVLETDPTHSESRRRLSEILFREGFQYLQDNLLNIACRTLEESLKWDPLNSASKKLLSKSYTQQYEMAVKQKNSFKMIVFLEKSLKIDPSQIDKRMILGEIYRRKQGYGKAEKQYEAILEIDLENQEAKENLGLILWKTGVDLQNSAPEEAQKALKRFLNLKFTESLKEKKNQVYLLFLKLSLQLGDEAFHQGKDEIARQFFMEILEMDESNGTAFCRLADIYLTLGKKAEAISFLEKGIPLLTDPLDISNYQGILDSFRSQK
ncbi:MAG: tetratricopeptide repeat protein [Planctomycetota bacterium]